jgi:hypothetical protein
MSDRDAQNDVLQHARRAGLELAIEQFPNDVLAAAAIAAADRKQVTAPADRAIEPWSASTLRPKR